VRDRCCQNNRGRFEGRLDWGNALAEGSPLPLERQEAGERAGREEAVRRDERRAFRKGEHRGDGENLTLPIALLRCARSPAEGAPFERGRPCIRSREICPPNLRSNPRLAQRPRAKMWMWPHRFVARPIVFAVASDDRILRDTAMAEEPSP
jgi:hypothetical protein